MIKADGSAKVKETLRLNALRRFGISLFVLAVAAAPCFAQISEKEAQGMEEQEFGIDQGKTATPETPSDVATPTATPTAQEPNSKLEDFQSGAQPEPVKPIEAEAFPVKAL